ncbi:three-Cys-motif partner protein TcmP [Nonomuraea basaltis]|uniref:three-Cys-motif partner protein TcmP n=1 Tax=Nonomuraea basaltis TaxID=2495887 RepID=UPI00110C5205|nr:three-Cys-motif partner protein TcmP [Nonomuraea basaltis]TMR93939.1 three-Cys-motif partner protein TcmP [Nonomuraea basaltis]
MAMGQPDELLWDSEPRTLIKHHIYRRYLDCWMGKVCQSFEYATIVDAFAGPGVYKDGLDGSPVVVAKGYLEHSHLERFKNLTVLCAEKREDRRDHLDGLLNGISRPAKLRLQVLEAGEALARHKELDAIAHQHGPSIPTLWILDPFDWAGVPFDLVKACLQRPRDEVLVTWFADELYRFCEHAPKQAAIDRHFGGSAWRAALEVRGEGPRKEALLKAYREGIERLSGSTFTESFSVASKNAHARYSLVFATHDMRGMTCFNQAKWRMDPHRGMSANEWKYGQPTLFDPEPDLSGLRGKLESLAGQARTFEYLVNQAQRLGFTEPQVRTTLTRMDEDGLAIRQSPVKSTTPWPAGSLIRFYAAAADNGLSLTKLSPSTFERVRPGH